MIGSAIKNIKDRIESGNINDDIDDRTCKCGICDGYGHVFTEHGVTHCQNSLKQELVTDIDKEMEAFEGWQKTTLSDLRIKAGFQETRSFLAIEKMYNNILSVNKPTGLILCGGHGRSKTLSSCCMLYTLSVNGIAGLGIKFPRLINEYKRGLDGRPFIETVFKKMANNKRRVVIVDEIGREAAYGNQEFGLEALQQIVNLCFRIKSLVLISNLNKKEFVKRLSSDICSRLHPDAGYCETIEEQFSEDLRQRSMW